MADRNASRTLIEFIQTYSDLQEKHLDAITRVMRETVDGVMAGIEEISKKFVTGSKEGHDSGAQSLDSDLETLLLSMMGQLSRDDIIKQRIEHVRMSMQALQSHLTYILGDYESRCTDGEVTRFVQDLKTITLRIYTMEDEKRLHVAVFQDDPRRDNKAS